MNRSKNSDPNMLQELERLSSWYQDATVRTADRIIVTSYSNHEIVYPKSRQIMTEHPLVQAEGDKAVTYLLSQSAYQFLYGVGLLETKFIIECSLDIINGHIRGADELDQLQALTVVIDEGFHAHVALDYIVQMKALSGIHPLQVPTSNFKLNAVQNAYRKLPPELHKDFLVLAVTLGENILTHDLVSYTKEKAVTEKFSKVMTDHVSDEGRHSIFFTKFMKAHWARLPESTKSQFKAILPEFVDQFLLWDKERNFDRKILHGYGFNPETAAKILADTDAQFTSNQSTAFEKTKGRLYRILQQIGAFEADQPS